MLRNGGDSVNDVTKWLLSDVSEEDVSETQSADDDQSDHGEPVEVRGPINEGANGDQVFGERRYPLRDRQRKKLPDFVCYVSNLVNDPVTVAEALSRSGRSKWIGAMKEEYDTLMRSETWVLVDLTSQMVQMLCLVSGFSKLREIKTVSPLPTRLD